MLPLVFPADGHRQAPSTAPLSPPSLELLKTFQGHTPPLGGPQPVTKWCGVQTPGPWPQLGITLKGHLCSRAPPNHRVTEALVQLHHSPRPPLPSFTAPASSEGWILGPASSQPFQSPLHGDYESDKSCGLPAPLGVRAGQARCPQRPTQQCSLQHFL